MKKNLLETFLDCLFRVTTKFQFPRREYTFFIKVSKHKDTRTQKRFWKTNKELWKTNQTLYKTLCFIILQNRNTWETQEAFSACPFALCLSVVPPFTIRPLVLLPLSKLGSCRGGKATVKSKESKNTFKFNFDQKFGFGFQFKEPMADPLLLFAPKVQHRGCK